jgi:hypothetical protein
MKLSAKLVTRVVFAVVIGAVGYDYYQIRQDAQCAHAATIRSGAHR